MPTDEPDVLTLDEGFAARKIRIREREDEDVNNLMISNRADKPVFLLAGEVILGGKQDRIIGANTVIPARTQLAVPVFCVEHGRWDDSSKGFRAAKGPARQPKENGRRPDNQWQHLKPEDLVDGGRAPAPHKWQEEEREIAVFGRVPSAERAIGLSHRPCVRGDWLRALSVAKS